MDLYQWHYENSSGFLGSIENSLQVAGLKSIFFANFLLLCSPSLVRTTRLHILSLLREFLEMWLLQFVSAFSHCQQALFSAIKFLNGFSKTASFLSGYFLENVIAPVYCWVNLTFRPLFNLQQRLKTNTVFSNRSSPWSYPCSFSNGNL